MEIDKILNHENTKFLKHEIYIFFFRVFVLSCFRDKYFLLMYLRVTTITAALPSENQPV